MTDITLFYTGARCTPQGLRLADVWAMNDQQYDSHHYFIQWVFPTDEASSVNSTAPLTSQVEINMFRSSAQLKLNLLKSLKQFLDFLGLRMDNRDVRVITPGKFYMRVQQRNHNWARITRVLRSLCLLGLQRKAVILFKFLDEQHSNGSINHVPYVHWKDALGSGAAIPLSPQTCAIIAGKMIHL